MKSVLISIRPEWVEKIASGKKTIEVRKSAPKEVPFKVYIYCTKGRDLLREVSCWNTKTKIHKTNYRIINLDYCTNKIANGKVIGEFICDKVERFNVGSLRSDDIEKLACLSYYEMICYFYKPEELDGKTAKQGFAWHISDLKIYDKPRELSEFRKACEAGCWCYNCKDFDYDATYDGEDNAFCDKKPITRPPQSWQYVEEVEE